MWLRWGCLRESLALTLKPQLPMYDCMISIYRVHTLLALEAPCLKLSEPRSPLELWCKLLKKAYIGDHIEDNYRGDLGGYWEFFTTAHMSSIFQKRDTLVSRQRRIVAYFWFSHQRNKELYVFLKYLLLFRNPTPMETLNSKHKTPYPKPP